MATSLSLKQLTHKDYTVAWICALPKEQSAVLLDEYHEKLLVDTHEVTYVLGRIDDHNVVIACLPRMGTNAAARCAALLQSSFKSLRFVLMVGIGGGVPARHDIRLGDVVVGWPGKTHRGVVQYDFGTQFQRGHLAVRDTQINPPPDILLTAVASLDMKYTRSRLPDSLGQKLANYAATLADSHPDFESSRRPETDQLFDASNIHEDDSKTCQISRCELAGIVERPRRPQENIPNIHKGLIASGNKVLRDSMERDRLAEELDVLCIEMEAGGLMADKSCLVIRGICDYCDSHKNKEWQEYAAAVASAYAIELLKVVPGLQGDEPDGSKSGELTGSRLTFSPANTSGGQFNNFMGSIHVSGGSASIGGTRHHK